MFEAPERRGETVIVDEAITRRHLDRFATGIAARDP